MKRKHFYILIGILTFIIPLLFLGILNSMVSLKYETSFNDQCISEVSGHNICESIKNLKKILLVDILLIFGLYVFRKRILKK
jgi:hypothetical protein